MSKASEWAQQRMDALLEFRGIDGQKPTKSPEVFINGWGWYHYHMDELGSPTLMLPGHGQGPERIILADNVPRLLNQAHWILDTFGEEKK